MEWANLDDIAKHYQKQARSAADNLYTGYMKAWDEIPEGLATILSAYSIFVYLPLWLIRPETVETSKTKVKYGTYIVYKTQVENDLAAAYNLAVLGHYSSANIILRACLEYLCRGAFFDCISKKVYRENTKLIQKQSKMDRCGERGSIEKLFQDIENLDPGFLEELESSSAVILDKLSVFMVSQTFRGMFPNFREIVEQLKDWDMLHPIDESVIHVYEGGYHQLSLSVHGSIDHIDTGKRLVEEDSLFALPSFDYTQFTDFLSHYYQVLDIGLVLTLNIMRKQAPGVKNTLNLVLSHPLFEQLPAKYFKQIVKELKSET